MTQKAPGEALERKEVSPMATIDQAKQIEHQTYPPPRGRRAPGGEKPLAQPKTSRIHPPDLRLKLVKLYLEESIPAEIIDNVRYFSHIERKAVFR